MGTFMDFINSLVTGKFDFAALGEFFRVTGENIKANADLMGLWETVLSATASFAFVIPIIGIAFGLIELIFGKKLVPVQRFLFCAVCGFFAGILYISPLINSMFPLPYYISGIVIAIVAAVLCKFIYFILLALAAGYSVYIVSINGLIPMLGDFTRGNWLIGLIAVAVAIILVFALRKYVEMLGTSVLGAFINSRIVATSYFDYRALEFLGGFGWLAELVVVAVIALIGFIIQIKTRKRY